MDKTPIKPYFNCYWHFETQTNPKHAFFHLIATTPLPIAPWSDLNSHESPFE